MPMQTSKKSTKAWWPGKPTKPLMRVNICLALAFVLSGSLASRWLYPNVLILPDVPQYLTEIAVLYAGNGGIEEASLRVSCIEWASLFADNGSYHSPPDYRRTIGPNATAAACEQMYAGRERPRRPVIEHIRPVSDNWESNGRTEVGLPYVGTKDCIFQPVPPWASIFTYSTPGTALSPLDLEGVLHHQALPQKNMH